jgi:hypothetical protein
MDLFRQLHDSELMNVLSSQIAMLAQGYDDVGGASRSSILFGILFTVGIFAFIIIKQKLKEAKSTEKENEWLQKKVRDLEREKEREREDEEMAEELESITPQELTAVKPVSTDVTARQFRIIHLDDEDWVCGMVGTVIRRKFENVNYDWFTNGNEAWEALSHTNPNLLITDLLNDNVPGRKEDFGTSGFHLLARLAEGNICYPILVISGSLTVHKYEAYVRQLFGSRLNISFIEKPFTTEQLTTELSKYITPAKHI